MSEIPSKPPKNYHGLKLFLLTPYTCHSEAWGFCRPRNLLFSCLRLQHPGLELAHFRIQRGRFQRPNQRLARLRRVQNRIDPEPSGGVAWVGLLFVGGAHRFPQLLKLLGGKLFSSTSAAGRAY